MTTWTRRVAVLMLAVAGGCDDAFLVEPPASPHVRWWDGFATQGLSNPVFTLAEHDGALYAGGSFLRAGTTTVNCIARWDGSGWTRLSNGVRRRDCTSEFCAASVQALTSWNGTLVAAGRFTVAGGEPALSVARWDGALWHAFGSGLNGDVHALAVYRDELVAGGSFVSSGAGTPLGYLARWADGDWAPFAGGTDGPVHALAVVGSDLVAAGGFERAGSVPARRLARWDGSSWTPMAQVTPAGTVSALLVSEGALIAAGNIDVFEIDQVYTVSLARWNGEAWSSLEHPRRTVYALCDFDGRLFAAAREGSRAHLFRFERGNWVPVSTGLDGEVRAMQGNAGHLFVAGTFQLAGDRPSRHIARWDE